MTQALDVILAIGTLGTAIFAGWAASSSRQAARASRDLARLEAEREERAAEDLHWRHARCVTVDLFTEEVADHGRRRGFDVLLTVTNAGVEPVRKARLKVLMGDAVWGPQLVGTITPGQSVRLTARLLTTADEANTDGLVRFTDARGNSWVTGARRPLAEDPPENLGAWIDEGRAFAQRDLSPAERGSCSGAATPDLSEWRTEMERLEGLAGR